MEEEILVTGGCGFIGREVTRQLLDKGYSVTVIDNLSNPASFIPKYKREEIKYQFFDLRDIEKTKRLFRLGEFDRCIHLAARVGGAKFLSQYPGTILSENGQINGSVFDAASENQLKRFVFISSAMAIEGQGDELSHYGFSKLSGERLCKALKEEKELKYSICRPFNIYGADEAFGKNPGEAHVIPDLVWKVLNNENGRLEIYGNGQQTRCFTHISDLADGIIRVMENKKAEYEDFNISVREETKILDLAEKIWYLCDKKEPFNPEFKTGFKGDVQKRAPVDCSKMETLLDWNPKITLEQGLKSVIEVMRKKYAIQ